MAKKKEPPPPKLTPEDYGIELPPDVKWVVHVVVPPTAPFPIAIDGMGSKGNDNDSDKNSKLKWILGSVLGVIVLGGGAFVAANGSELWDIATSDQNAEQKMEAMQKQMQELQETLKEEAQNEMEDIAEDAIKGDASTNSPSQVEGLASAQLNGPATVGTDTVLSGESATSESGTEAKSFFDSDARTAQSETEVGGQATTLAEQNQRIETLEEKVNEIAAAKDFEGDVDRDYDGQIAVLREQQGQIRAGMDANTMARIDAEAKAKSDKLYAQHRDSMRKSFASLEQSEAAYRDYQSQPRGGGSGGGATPGTAGGVGGAFPDDAGAIAGFALQESQANFLDGRATANDLEALAELVDTIPDGEPSINIASPIL